MTNRNDPIRYFDLLEYDRSLRDTNAKEENTVKITFPHLTECQGCGYHKYKINGVVYYGDTNHIDLKVKCMRCGKLFTHLKTRAG